MDRRAFFRFLGFGAAAAPVVAAELAAAPGPVPVLPPAVNICPSAFYLPQGFSGTYSITLRMPGSVMSHNWGLPEPLPPAVRDREFYRLRHARKHGGF